MLGSGLGYCLQTLADQGPVVVVDREQTVLAQTGLKERFADNPNVLWLDQDAENVLKALQHRRFEAGELPLAVLRLPLYQRLDPAYYRVLADRLERPTDGCPWAAYPRFCSSNPRVLLLRTAYFLYREIEAALTRLGVPYVCVDVGKTDRLRDGFVEDLLRGVADFRPDFLLTVNHFGLDREGRIAGLLHEAGLPLASWFVDNPHLILHEYPGQNRPGVAVFSFDAGSLEALRQKGFGHVEYLPLATDPEIFRPGVAGRDPWRARVSFVGESLTDRVEALAAALDGDMALQLRRAGYGYVFSLQRDALAYLREQYPTLAEQVLALTTAEKRLAAESLLTFEAARQYRLERILRLREFAPLIAGDRYWPGLLGDGGWRFLPYLDYYSDLPGFYACSEINFNCTSAQMKGAVNQRVFDVPAAGGFLLTDQADQLNQLFEPGREVVTYGAAEEISEVVRRWLDDPVGRQKVVERAGKRILAEHTYIHRLGTLLHSMRFVFA